MHKKNFFKKIEFFYKKGLTIIKGCCIIIQPTKTGGFFCEQKRNLKKFLKKA